MFTKPPQDILMPSANVDPPKPIADIDRQKPISIIFIKNSVASQIAFIKAAGMCTIVY